MTSGILVGAATYAAGEVIERDDSIYTSKFD